MNPHARVYQTNMALGASALDKVISTYDVAIAACHNQNNKQACDALCLLLQSLRSSANKDLAEQFCLFYSECGAMIHQLRYAEVESMLITVKRSWSKLDN